MELHEVEQSYFRESCHIVGSDSVGDAAVEILSRFVGTALFFGCKSDEEIRNSSGVVEFMGEDFFPEFDRKVVDAENCLASGVFNNSVALTGL
jgi:hypothetical protein